MSSAQIDHPSAWTGREIGGREGLTHRVSAAQLAAIDGLVQAVRGRDFPEITRADFSHPAVDALMQAARHQVMHGHGAIILSGFDVARYSVEDYALLYWGLGTHLGRGAVQSHRGDFMGYVRREENGQARGYTTDMELRSHTDFHEILSLAAVSGSASGGESGLVSALAIHNAIARERPELLAPLYAGAVVEYPRGEWRRQVPIFCEEQGRISCFCNRVFMPADEMPPELKEALAFFDDVAARPEVRADFMLEPGEMVFWHNYQMLHSRRSFADTAEQKRLLLRLWLNVPEGRPMAAPIRELTRRIDASHAGMALLA